MIGWLLLLAALGALAWYWFWRTGTRTHSDAHRAPRASRFDRRLGRSHARRQGAARRGFTRADGGQQPFRMPHLARRRRKVK